MKPRVVYWNNIPAPYMVERFNAVVDRGNLDFEAWFNERTHSDRSWEVEETNWRFPYRYLPSLHIAGCHLRFPLPLLKNKIPDVLVSLYAEPVFLAGWTIARLRNIRTAFWVEVTFDRWIQRRSWKEIIKRQLFTKVEGVITVGSDGRNFTKRYGMAEEKIFFAPHTIDVEHYKNGRVSSWPEREKARKVLGLRGITFIYVGRLWWGKGVTYLLDAFRDLQNNFEDEISLLLVGDGTNEAALKNKCCKEGIRNVVFVGFKQKSELPLYFTVSDVFVFPTLGDPYGLVVDEAMACSLPIISTSATGEVRIRIEEGVNGYIVPPEDSNALYQAMKQLAEDPELRKKMGKISAERIQGHTPERWAKDFEGAIRKILSMS